MDKKSAYQQLFERFCKAYPERKKRDVQEMCNQFWNQVKQSEDFSQLLEEKQKDLLRLATEKKNRYLNFFNKATKQFPSTKSVAAETPTDTTIKDDNSKPAVLSAVSSEPDAAKPGPSRSYKCHKQNELKARLNVLNADILGLEVRLKNNLTTVQQEKDLQRYRQEKAKLEKDLKKAIDNQERQQQFRDDRKRKTDEILQNEPAKAAKLGLHRDVGRPRRDDEQEILNTILGIAQYGASTHDRRRLEQLRTVKTLDDLVNQMKYCVSNPKF